MSFVITPVVSIPTADGKRSDVDKDDITCSLFTSEDTSLNSGIVGDGLVGVDTLERLLATEVILKNLLNLRDTDRTTNEYDIINFVLRDVSILENLFNGLHRLAKEI